MQKGGGRGEHQSGLNLLEREGITGRVGFGENRNVGEEIMREKFMKGSHTHSQQISGVLHYPASSKPKGQGPLVESGKGSTQGGEGTGGSYLSFF